MLRIQPNANFHTVTEKTVFDVRGKDEKFLEYRRRWYEFPTNFIVGAFPMHLDIESTSICNLRCPFCATTFGRWGPEKCGFMDMGLFKKIIDEGAECGLYSIKLSLRGEPLLHPRIVDMVEYAKDKGIIDIYFNTNAVLLDTDMIGKLLDAGLFRISISIEGTTKEVYERYRVGAKFEDVLNNVKNLRKIRDEKNLSFPQIRVQTLLLDELKESLPSYVQFWKEIAEEVSYLDARKETSESNYDERVADWACPFLWQRMSILWDGTLLPCLIHGVSDLNLMNMGNAKQVSIKNMWNSSRYNELRRLHKQGQTYKIKACKECSYRTMEIDKINE